MTPEPAGGMAQSGGTIALDDDGNVYQSGFNKASLFFYKLLLLVVVLLDNMFHTNVFNT